MTTIRENRLRRYRIGCLTAIVLIPLVYYGIHALLRTQPLTSLQIIGHRGGVKDAPENTLAAFRESIAQGIDWLEFDVQMTKDGALIVIHDETVDRTTNGTGAVRDLTLEQARSLDAGQGERIPTFKEVIELAKANGKKIMPEAKSAHLYSDLEGKILQTIEQADYLDQTIIQSFEADSLEELHRLNPRAKLCALYGLWQFDVSEPPGDAQYVCPMAEMVLLNPGMIRQAHLEGRQVFIYFGVIENPFGISLMHFFGADGLIVDDAMAIIR